MFFRKVFRTDTHKRVPLTAKRTEKNTQRIAAARNGDTTGLRNEGWFRFEYAVHSRENTLALVLLQPRAILHGHGASTTTLKRLKRIINTVGYDTSG